MHTETFIQTDGGKKAAGFKEKNDCTVRALALATGTSYAEAHVALADDDRRTGKGHDFKGWLYRLAWQEKSYHGFIFDWFAFKAVRGESRMTRDKFCREYPVGAYILREAKHVFAVIDGVAHDTGKSYEGRCVYGAWKVTKPN